MSIVGPDPHDAPAAPARSSSGSARPLAVTIAVVLLVIACGRIPVADPRAQAFRLTGSDPIGLLSLGLNPFLSAFVLVELLAAAIPALRRRRAGAPGTRAPLARAAIALGFAFAALQGWGVATFLESAGVAAVGGIGRPVVAAALVTGSALTLAAAGWISRRGLGDGFAVVLSAQAFVELARTARATVGASSELLLIISLIPAAFILLAFVRALLANELRAERGDPLDLRHPASGVVPLAMSSSLVLLPATLSGWVPGLQPLAELLRVGSLASTSFQVFLVVALSVLLAFLFNRPGAIAAAWSLVPGAQASAAAVASQVGRGAARSAALLAAALLLPLAFSNLIGVGALRANLIVGLTLAVATVADLRAEWRARRAHGDLVAVWTEPRVHAADAILAALRAAGIPAFGRAIHYRTLTRFFGPWAPIVVLVPRERAEEAEKVAALVGGGGLSAG